MSQIATQKPSRSTALHRMLAAIDARLKILPHIEQPYGWQQEGSLYALMARNPRGLYD